MDDSFLASRPPLALVHAYASMSLLVLASHDQERQKSDQAVEVGVGAEVTLEAVTSTARDRQSAMSDHVAGVMSTRLSLEEELQSFCSITQGYERLRHTLIDYNAEIPMIRIGTARLRRGIIQMSTGEQEAENELALVGHEIRRLEEKKRNLAEKERLWRHAHNIQKVIEANRRHAQNMRDTIGVNEFIIQYGLDIPLYALPNPPRPPPPPL